MKIKAGEYDILDSGTVISYNNDPVTFYLADDFILSMSFKSDPLIKEYTWKFTPISKFHLNVTLINFDEPLGVGNVEPLNLGSFQNKTVYLNFRVYKLNENSSSRTIHYTWYLGKEVANA